MATGTGPVMGPIWFLNSSISAADLPNNTVQNEVAPVDGFVHELVVVVQVTVTTGGTITLTDVTTGLLLGTVTVPNGAAAGTVIQGTVTPLGTETGAKLWPKVAKNDNLRATPVGFASAGAVRFQLRGYAGE